MGQVPVASVTVTPSPTAVGVGRTAQLEARAFDADGEEITGRTATWSTADEAIATVTGTGLVTGVAPGGPVSITATIDGVSGSAQVSVSLVPVATVSVAPPSSTIAAGATVQLAATLRDDQGNILTGRTVTWSSANDAVAPVSSTGLVTGQRAGGPVTITATSEGRSATAQVTVTVGAVARLIFIQQPSNIAAGNPISPAMVVEAQDAGGNRVTSFNGLIAMAILNNPGGAGILGTTTTGAVNGRATFSNVSLNRPGTGYTLVATSGSLAVTSTPFNVVPGAPSRLVFVTQPSNVTAGEVIAPAVRVEIRDQFGNPVTSSTASVTVALENNPGDAGTLGGTRTVNAVAGVATFSTLTVDRAASGYTLRAASGSLEAATSSAFEVRPGAASQLVFRVQPVDVTAGVVIDPAVQVEAQDALGNLVPTFGGQVALVLQGGPVDAVLAGTTTLNATSGAAAFADLSISRAGTNYVLVASAPGLTSATTQHFTVSAAAASSLVFVVQPTTTDEGDPISPAPVVEARDGFGNRVESFTGTVTIIVRSTNGTSAPPSGTTLSGTPAVAAVAGQATFSNLRITVSADRQLTLRATTTSPSLAVVSQIFLVLND